MRRLLMFLAVFGVGAAVLWHFESKRRAEEAARTEQKAVRDPRAPERPPPAETTEPEPRSQQPSGPPAGTAAAEPPQQGAPRQAQRAVIRGWFEVDWPGEGDRPDLDLAIDDLQPVGESFERYVARGIRIVSRIRGAAEVAVRETVDAESGAFEFETEAGGPVGLAPDVPLSLNAVRIVRERDAALVPLTLRAPRMALYFERGRYESVEDDLVEVEGPGLEGSGRALVYDGETQRLTLGRGARVRFALEDGRIVDFWTTGDGPLSLTRGVDGAFEASAEGGARLELLGDPPATLDARSIVVVLRPGVGDALTIDSARAQGTVVVRQGTDRYTGDSARVVSPKGELERVVLNDSPEARVTVRSEQGDDDIDIIVSGAGPLAVDVVRITPEQRRATFVFQGPGKVAAPARGLEITFDDRVEARAREDEGRAEFVAAGGVVARRGDVRVETESLSAELLGGSVGSGGGRELTDILAVTEGPTVVTGRTDDGAHVEVDALGGLTARLVDARGGIEQGRWLLDRAEDVRFVVDGEDPFEAEAGLLREGDLAARSFRAEGTVAYRSPLGVATATQGMVRGPERVELRGDKAAPARLVLAPSAERFEGVSPSALIDALGDARSGELTAETIELTEATLDARGGVSAEFEAVDGRLELDADQIRLSRPAPSQDPLAVEPIVLIGNGVRRAELFGEQSRFRIAAARVDVDGALVPRTALVEASASGAESSTAPPAAGRRLWIDGVVGTGAVQLELRTEDGELSIDADELQLAREGVLGSEVHVTATRVTQVTLDDPERAIRASCERLDVRGRIAGDALVALGSRLVAEGDVWVQESRSAELEARCERLELVDGQRAELSPPRGGRITATGRLPTERPGERGAPYTLEADRIVHAPDRLEAFAPELRLDGAGVNFELLSGVTLSRLSAGHMLAVPEQVTFDAGVEAEGVDREGTPISLRAGSISARPEEPLRAKRTALRFAQDDPAPTAPDQKKFPLQGLEASGGFEARYGGVYVRAESISTTGTTLRLTGWRDEPAVLEYGGMTVEATWLHFDTEEYLVTAGRGILRSAPGPDAWSMSFASIEPRLQDDESMVVIASPRLVRGRDEARADWVSIWLLRDAWRAMGRSALYDEGAPPPPPPPSFAEREIPGPDLLAEALLGLQEKEFAAYVRAVYAEGDLEVEQGGSRASRADSLYLDVGEASGWLAEAELVQRVDAGRRSELVRIRSKRLETDGSGRLVAESATLTTCDHDNPHYVVLTSELALEPRPDGRWRFGARGNRLSFANGLQVPLPSIGNAVLDERGGFEGFENEKGEVTPLNSLTLAQTARFGASIGASFGFETGRIGRFIADLFGMNTDRIRGRWDTDARWLGDRGPLLSAKLELRERKPRDEVGEDFRMEFYIAGIPDRGEDRGVLRVDTSEREEERFFGWIRGRYPIVRGEWIDMAFSSQTDPGVQAEFFENEHLRWDERDTFVRWRKSRNGVYYAAGLSKRVDAYRTQVEELPSLGVEMGQREVASLGRASLLYGGSFDVAHLRRLEGDPGRDPFSVVPGGEALGLDGREVVRANVNQRLDVTVPTGLAGIRAVPFLELDATGWTENQLEDDDASRFALLGGMEMATVLHSTSAGYTSVLAPYLGASTDIVHEQRGGAPTPFDALERPIDGDVYEAGLRGLWTRLETFESLDMDLKLRQTEGQTELDDRTEVGVLGRWITRVGRGAEARVGMQHDGRYDIETGETNYSRSTLAWSPNDIFMIEGRYARARGIDGTGLFEAAGVDARWTLDPKWELQVRHTWSLTGEGNLESGVAVRRFAHDFLLEFEVSRRAGEGGTTFGISFSPLLAWRRPLLGILDRR